MSASVSASAAAKYAEESRKLSDSNLGKSIFYAALLLLVHFISIKPKSISLSGFDLTIPDPSIFRGVIALVFFYYFHQAILYNHQAHFIDGFNPSLYQYRYYLRASLKRGRTVKAAKRIARFKLARFFLSISPFLLVIISALAASIAIGAHDLYEIARYFYSLIETKGIAQLIAG